MKTYLITFSAAILILVSCKSTSRPSANNSGNISGVKNDTVRIANDELEYEILIIDPGFDGFLARAKPRGFYEQHYLENKNIRWVTEWNSRFNQNNRFYDMRIEYSPNINYGYEVNYMLYNYLVYFQQKTGQRLGGVVPDF
jgi:hypothetical protein